MTRLLMTHYSLTIDNYNPVHGNISSLASLDLLRNFIGKLDHDKFQPLLRISRLCS